MKRIILSSLIAAFLIFAFSGCEDDNGITAPSNNLTLSIKAENTTLAKSFADSIVLDTIKILFRDLRLGVCGCSDSANVRCECFVVYLKPDGSLTQISISQLPYGTYQSVKFYLHKPDPSETPPDPDFKCGAGSEERFSIIVYGRINDSTFIYRSKSSAVERITFDQPVLVGAGGITNITMLVNPYTWFTLNGITLHPGDPSAEHNIDNNIKTSFIKAFRDNNKDGKPDS